MPNFIQCVGYALGKVHTGMLCYLPEFLYNEGEREPAESFFAALGISPLPKQLQCKRELSGIDLMVFDAEPGALSVWSR
ncbi:MAG: hypothetical protein FWD55_08980 [Propionibacteriaceae bacterium]|nr:hypothetical protein [Propionibacteriaceae bacterium]